MTEFTDALLALSREPQRVAPAETTCDVYAVLARVVEDQRSVAPEKHIVVDLHGGPPRVAAPESMVAMTLGNLVRNAVQHGTSATRSCAAPRAVNWWSATPAPCPPASWRNIPPRFTSHPGGHGMGLYLGQAHLRALRLGDPAGKCRRGVTATVI